MARLHRLIAIAVLSIAGGLPAAGHSAAATEYVIRSGDTLIDIASRFGVPLSALLEANGLTMTTTIFPGEQLTIPGSGGAGGSSSGSSGAQYTVRAGDALFTIARRHDVTLGALLAANGLTADSVIYPGQTLTIPGSGAAAGDSSSGSSGAQYTVRSGDYLFAIARRHDITLGALLAANGLTATTVIHPGQRLTIPGASSTPSRPPAASGTQYTVVAGDFLGAIAERHGVTLTALLTANGLSITSVIHPGQRLTIPGGGSAPSRPPAASGGAQYTVRAGDSLGVIAARHDVTLAALLEVNGLTVNSVIHPGDRLTLPAGAVVSKVDRVLAYALAQVGKSYKFFTAGPNSFDCSGLTKAAYAQVGISLVHHSATQARQGTAVDFRNEPIRPGDLVFLNTNGGDGINHVGIAINDSSWVQARSPALGVRITGMPSESSIIAVRRFLPAG